MSQQFPLSWFFIKNQNGYVLSASQGSAGANIVISTLRTDEPAAQLWRHDNGLLINKESGLVMEVVKGNLKASSEIVQQAGAADKAKSQHFSISKDGHICLKEKPNLVLGFKESFFSRREGLHVHLQSADKRSKEQHWNFVLPVVKSSSSSSAAQVKRSASSSTVGSSVAGKPISRGISQIKEDDARSTVSASTTTSSLDQEGGHVPTGTFPDTPFFLKSQQTGLYISAEATSMTQEGGRLVVDALRKTGYDSQLWTFDKTTGHILNKHSGFALSFESLKDDSYACQTKKIDNNKNQIWSLSSLTQEIHLKHDSNWVLGLKESWFGTSSRREGAHLHIQKKNGKNQENQKFAVVLPVFKKRVVDSTTEQQQGTFPDGWFFIKNQASTAILTISGDSDIITAKLDTSNYSRQLWRYKNGFLINKSSGKVLDVRGGSIENGAGLCQYDQKKKSYQNQQWALTVEGFIHIQSNNGLVLSSQTKSGKTSIYLADKLSVEHKEQRWNFVLPVFKKKSGSRAITSTSTKTKVVSYRYAQYPSGWFFIRSLVRQSTKESPLVLTANGESVTMTALDKENWQSQLWSYSSGALVNYQSQLAIDVKSVVEGANLTLAKQEITPRSQRWTLSIDGYLVNGFEPSLVLTPQANGDNFKLALATHSTFKEEHRWGLLIPEFIVRQRVQILIRWSVAMLQEWRKSGQTTLIKTVSRTAAWPEDEFFITTNDGYALAPAKPEAYSDIGLYKVDEHADAELFQWKFEGGYLVHCMTGLVLHSNDSLADGDKLTIRGKHMKNETQADDRQLWTLHTNGEITSSIRTELGLSLIKQSNGQWQVLVSNVTKRAAHYGWSLMYGTCERRYSEIHKKEILVVITLIRIILMIRTTKASSTAHKLVTQKYGIFPKEWFFVRSKQDKSLVITASTSKEGDKLTLEKIDFKNYKRQLWKSDDSGCLVNMESSYVIDVAGGKLMANCNIIQWHEKFLRRSRKNQQWGLSVDGHIHPQSRPGLVLAPRDNSQDLKEHTVLQLKPRGALNAVYQQWSFAVPVLGKRTATRSNTILEDIGEANVEIADRERYERIEKRTIVHRWGIFPSGGIFIRLGYGAERLALTVEKTESASEECYAITARPLNYKEYKWQMWTYEEGHLINTQTGLALDSAAVTGGITEYGLKSRLYVKTRSESETQYWSLGVDGEIHQRYNERMVVSVSSADRATTAGAQIGLRELHVRKEIKQGKQELVLQSEKWLRWTFSKPVYGKRTTTTTTTTSTSEAQEEEIKECEDQDILIEEQNETDDGASTDDDTTDDDSSEDEDDDDDNASIVSSASNARSVKSTTSSASSRKDSFTTTDDYIPTGFEKVVRYKNQSGAFPTSGYFLIKSELHGYVLDVDGDAKEGAPVILTPLRATDFASQMWSYKDGYLVNLKGQVLVLDAAEEKLIAGGQPLLSVRTPVSEAADQRWEHSSEGLVYLLSKRSWVLSIKDLKRTDKPKINVYIQEEKTHGNLSHGAKKEQRWVILVPSLIPVEKKETGVKIIEAGKKTTTTSSSSTGAVAASAIVSSVFAFKWLKEALSYKITKQDAWPSSSKAFFIRVGGNNTFLAAGHEKGQVGLYKLTEQEDYKRFLWIYVDGYLVNYKYLLRLVYITRTRQWILSDSQETADQSVHISANGLITVRISATIIYYLRIIRRSSGDYELDVTDNEASATKSSDACFELHIPQFVDQERETDVSTTISNATAYASKQKQLIAYKYKKTIITTKRALFPAESYFFIKADGNYKESWVLAVDGDAPGTSLVIKKLSFTDYKDQLWTFRDGLLINYGSDYVISIQGGIAPSAKIVQHLKTTGSLKWFLTVDGLIRLHGYGALSLGYRGGDLGEGTAITLALAETSERTIRWKFSIPVFGKKKTTTTISEIKEELSKGTQLDTIEELTTEVSKEQEQQEVTKTQEQDNKMVLEQRKKLAFATSESWTIILAWRIYFIRRIRQCRTKAEIIDVIQESRDTLYKRLDVHYKRHCQRCTGHGHHHEHEHQELPSEWELSIEHIRDLFRLRLFEGILGKLISYEADQEISADDIDSLESIVESTYGEVETYVQEEEKKQGIDTSIIKKEQEEQLQVVVQSKEEAKEQALVLVSGVKTTVRYWLVIIRRRILEAKKNGASEQEIAAIIENSRKELTTELSVTRTQVVQYKWWSYFVTSSTSAEAAQKSTVESIERIETLVSKHIDTITYESDAKLIEWVNQGEQNVNVELDTSCKHVFGEQVKEQVKQEQEVEKTTTSVQVIEATRKNTSTELIRVQDRLSSWYAQLTYDLNWCFDGKHKDQQKYARQQKDSLLIVVDSAKLDLINYLEQAKWTLESQSTTLTLEERRRIEYAIETVRSTLIAYLLRFRRSVAVTQEQDVSKSSIACYLEFSFGSETQKNTLQVLQDTASQLTVTVVEKEEHHIVGEKKQEVVQHHDDKKQQVVEHHDDKKESSSSGLGVAAGIGLGIAAGGAAIAVHQHHEKEKQAEEAKKHAEKIAEEKKHPQKIVEEKKAAEKVTEEKKETEKVTEEKKTEGEVSIGVVETTKPCVPSQPSKSIKELQISISKWYAAFIKHVSTESTKPDCKDVYIAELVRVETDTILAHLDASKDVISKTTTSTEEWEKTIEYIRGTITTGSEQLQGIAIGVISGKTTTDSFKQLEIISSSNDQQITEALTKYESKITVVETGSSSEKVTAVPVETKKPVVEETQESGKASGKVEKVTEETHKIVKHDNKKKDDEHHHHTGKVAVGVAAGAVVTIGVVGYVKSTVSWWFSKLSKDIADRVEQGGDNVNADIEVIVSKATAEIDAEFAQVVSKTNDSKDKESADKLKATIEWAKNNVAQTTTQIQAVAVQAVAGGSTTAVTIHEQLSGVIKATTTQVDTALDNCQADVKIEVEKTKTEKITSEVKKTDEHKVVKHDDKKDCKKVEKKDDDHHHAGKVAVGVTAGAAVTIGVVGYVKSTVSWWFNKLSKDIADRVEQGGDNVNADIEVIVSKATAEIDAEFAQVVSKTNDSKDKESADKLKATIEWAKNNITQTTTQIQAVAVQAVTGGSTTAVTIHEQLSGVIKATTTQVDTALDNCQADVKIEVEKTKTEKITTEVKKTEAHKTTKTEEDHKIVKHDAKKVEKKDDDHHHAGKVAVGVVAGAAVTIGVVGYVKSTVSWWFNKLSKDIADRVEQGGDNVNADIEVIVSKATAEIDAEFAQVVSKTNDSKDKESADKLKATIEWAKNNVAQTTTQIQAVAVQAVAGGSTTAVTIHEQLSGVIKATTTQVDTALDNCQADVKIEVEKTKTEKITSEVKKTEDHKATKTEVAHKVTKHDGKKDGKKPEKKDDDHHDTGKIAAGIGLGIAVGGAAIAVHQHHEKEKQAEEAKKHAKKIAEEKKHPQKIVEEKKAAEKVTEEKKETEKVTEEKKTEGEVSIGVVETTKPCVPSQPSKSIKELQISISKWYAAFIKHVSTESTKPDCKDVYIAELVRVETDTILAHLDASKDVISKTTTSTEEWEKTIEYIRGTITTGSEQLQGIAIGVISGKTTTDSFKQLEIISSSNDQQITEALTKYESKITVVEETHESVKTDEKVSDEAHDVVKHEDKKTEKKNDEHHHSGKVAVGVAAGAVVSVGVVGYVKSTVSWWFDKLSKDIAERVEKGGDNVNADIEVIVSKATAEIDTEFSKVISKTSHSNDEESADRLKATIGWAKSLVTQATTQVQAVAAQAIATGGTGAVSIHEQLSDVISSTTTQVETALDNCQVDVEIDVEKEKAEKVSCGKKQPSKTEVFKTKVEKKSDEHHDTGKKVAVGVATGAVVTVGVVGYVKSTVNSWFTKLMNDVSERAEKGGDNVSADIEAIIVKANQEIEVEFSHVATKTDAVSNKESAAKLKETLEWAKGIVVQSSTQIQATAVDAVAVGGSTALSIHEQLSSLVQATHTQIDTALQSCDTKLTIDVEGEKVVENAKKSSKKATAGVSVGVAEYVKITISTWYSKLAKDIASCKTNEEVEAVIVKANASIEADLKVVTEKTKKSEVSTSVSEQIVSTTEWAKGIVLEGSNQLKVIGGQIVAGSTTAKDSIAGLIESTEKQIEVAYDKCDTSVTIEVKHAKVPAEHVHKIVKHGSKKGCKKTEKKDDHHAGKVAVGIAAGAAVTIGVVGYVKSTVSWWFSKLSKDIADRVEQGGDNVNADIEVIVSKATAEIDAEFAQVVSKTNDSKDKESADKLKATIEWAKNNVAQTTTQIQAVAVQAVTGGNATAVTIHEQLSGMIKATTNQVDTALDNCQADVKIEVEKKTSDVNTAVVTAGEVTVGTAEYVKVTVKSWFRKLMDDVASCKTDEEIEQVVVKANIVIEEELKVVCDKTAESDEISESVSQQILSTTEWAKGMVLEGSSQIKVIGAQIVAAGGSASSGAKQSMVALIESTEQQIDTAYDKCDTSLTIAVEHAKVPAEHVHKVVKHESKKSKKTEKDHHTAGKVAAGVVIGGAVIGTGAAVAVGITAAGYVKSTVSSWYERLTKAVAERAEQGGDNAAADIEIIVAEANKQIEAELSQVAEKTEASSDKESVAKWKETLEWAKSTVTQSTAQVQTVAVEAVTVGGSSAVSIHEKLSSVADSIHTQIDTALQGCDEELVIEIEKEKIVDNVKKPGTEVVLGAATVGVIDYVKVTISSWYSKLAKDIASCKTNEEVEAVIVKANASIEADLKVVTEKTKKSEVSTSVSEQIVSTTEWAKGIILEGSNQLKVIGGQIVAGSTTAKDSIAGLIESTEKQIEVAYDKCDTSVTIEVKHAKVPAEHVHKIVKHGSKKGCKKTEKKDDHHAGKVAVGIAAGAAVTIGVVGYVKSTVSWWFSKLSKDIADRVEQGGDNVNADIEVIVSKATAEIDAEFAQVVSKTNDSKDKESADKLKATIEWAKNNVAQTTTQIQAVAVQAVAGGSTTAVTIHEQLSGVIKATTTQVDTALDNCQADVKIEVEKTKTEKITSEVKKTDEHKVVKHDDKKDCKKVEKKDDDHHHAGKVAVGVAAGAAVTIGVVGYVKSTVSWWFNKLSKDIADRVEQGGDNVNADIEVIVSKATAEIDAEFAQVVSKTNDSKDKESADKLKATIEWAKNNITQTTTQIQAVAVQAVTGGSTTAVTIHEQLSGVIKATTTQVDTALDNCQADVKIEVEKTKTEKITTEVKKTEAHKTTKTEEDHKIVKHDAKKVEKKDDDHHHAGKVAVGVVAGAAVTIGVVGYVKSTVSWWFNKLSKDIADRVEQGGDNVNADIEVIVSKATAEIDAEFAQVVSKTNDSKDKESADKLKATIEWAKNNVAQTTTQIQAVAVQAVAGGSTTAVTIHEQLSGVIKATTTQVDTALDNCQADVKIEVEKTKTEKITSEVKKTEDHKATKTEVAHKVTKHDGKKDGKKPEKKDDDHHDTGKIAAGIGLGIAVGGAAIAVHQHHEKEKQAEEAKKHAKKIAEEKKHPQKIVEEKKAAEKVTEEKKETEKVTEEKKTEGEVSIGVVETTKPCVPSQPSKSIKELQISISKWYAAFIKHVSTESTKPDCKDVYIAELVRVETDTILAHLDASKDVISKTTTSTEEWEKTIEYIRGTITTGSEQLQGIAIGVISGKTTTDSFKQLEIISSSNDQQITEALTKYESKITVVEETHESVKTDEKVSDEAHDVVKHEDKKTEKKNDEHHHSGKVAVGVAAGAVVSVGVVGYVKSTVSSWFNKLSKDIADRVEQGGDNVNADIEVIVSKATAEIDAEFAQVVSKTNDSKDKESVDKLKATIEWTKNNVTQTTTQVQAVAVQAVTGGSATAVTIHEQLSGVIKATTTQVDTALDNCQADVKIEVEKTKTEKITSDVKKTKEHENKAPKAEKKEEHVKHHEIEMTHDAGKKVVAGVFVSVGVIEYTKLTIRSWFNKLMDDVSTCAANGGTDEEIDIIVSKATDSIEDNIEDIVDLIKSSSSGSSSVDKINATLEWANGMVIQGSTQVQAIGVQSIASGHVCIDSIREQMKPLVEANVTQIETALGSCDSSIIIEVDQKEKTEKTQQAVKLPTKEEMKSSEEKKVIKKKPACEKPALSTGEAAEIIAGGVVAVGAVAYVKSTINSWFDKLTKAVAERAEQGGDNASVDIEAIIAKANAEIDVEFSKVTTKTGETDSESAAKLKETIEWAKTTVVQGTTQVQTIAVEAVSTGRSGNDAIHEKLTSVVKSTTAEVDAALEKCDSEINIKVEKKASDVKEAIEHAGQVTVGVVDYVKVTISSWYSKLIEDIYSCKTNEEVESVIAEANATIEADLKVVADKTKKSDASVSVSEQIISTTEWAKGIALEGSNQLKVIGVEIVAGSTTAKDNIAGLIESSEKQIATAYEKCDSSLIIEVDHTKIDAEDVHKVVKHDSKKSKIKKHQHKQTKKDDEHHHAGKVAVGVVAGGAVAIGVVGYVKSTVSWWFNKLSKDIADRVEQGGDNVNADIEVIVSKATAEIDAEFAQVVSKTNDSKDKESADKLKATIEWAKNNITQTTTQIQAVAVQAVTGGSTTAVTIHEQLSGVIKATTTQVDTALDNCQADVKIEVEKTKVEKVTSEVKKTEEHKHKDSKVEKTTEEAHKVVKHDDKKETKKAEKKSGDHHSGKVATGVVGGALITVGVVGYVKSTVHSWFNKLTKDIAERAEKGGDNVNEDIEIIIAEATEKIDSEFSQVVSKTDESSNKESADKLKATLEWAKSMVSQSTTQVHAVAVQAIAAGESSAAAIQEQLTTVTESTTTQVDTALGSCKTDLVIEVEKKGEKQKTSVEKPKKSVDITVGVVEYVKITISTWYSKLAKDIASCKTNEEVEAVIVKANASIEADLKVVTEKTKKSEVSTSVSEQIVSTTEWAKGIVLEGSNQLKVIGGQIVAGSTTAKDSIAGLIESTEKQIEVAYDKCGTSLTIEVEHAKVAPEHVHKVVKHDAKKAKAKKEQRAKAKKECASKHESKKKDDKTLQHIVEGSLAVGVVAGAGAAAVAAKKKASGKKTTSKKETSGQVISAVETVDIAKKAAKDTQDWFYKLIVVKFTQLLESSAGRLHVNSETEHIIGEAEIEVNDKINELQRGTSSVHLEEFFGHLRTTFSDQLSTIKTTILEGPWQNASEQESALYGIATRLNEQIAVHVAAVETAVAEEEEIVVGEHHVETEVKEKKTTVVKKKQPIQLIEVTKIETIKTDINGWFTRLIERIKTCCKQTDVDVNGQVTTIIAEAQGELEGLIKSSKSNVSVETDVEYNLSVTLETIYTTAISQANLSKTIAIHGVDVDAQLDNVVLVSGKQVEKLLQVHIVDEKTGESSCGAILLEKKETKEETQARVQKEVTLAIQDTKTQLSGWLDLLIKNIHTSIQREGCDVSVEIQRLIEEANQQVDGIIKTAKAQIVSSGDEQTLLRTDATVAANVSYARNQALHCIDQIKITLYSQTTSLKQVVARIDSHDIATVDERVLSRIALIRDRLVHSLDYAASVTISAAFEGKTVAWVETTQMPESFAGVRAIAFDLVGTVTDFRTSFAAAWSAVIKNKKAEALHKIDALEFADKWYALFLQRKGAEGKQQDQVLLRTILIELLATYNIKEDAFTAAQLDKLVLIWRRSSLFKEVTAGIKRVKHLNHGTVTVSFSQTFQTRTMVDLARHGCLCWHAQFGADVVPAESSEAFVNNVSDLLALENTKELAIVSANPEVLRAAKTSGAHTVLIHRSEHTSTQEFDLEVDGIDMLAESFEAMLDQKEAQKQAATTTTTVAGRTWFQRVVDTASSVLY
ncbi:hypothetical protein BDA99DRAFT_560413 [Phascolomyces articulosus]|uniref:Ricin B lectin domain-containing protein n=1 Tax=Phascolomyces articulosus TaxID=60185 RepID=A0AAD5PDP9_9FUNG|nr:hypothetical protein BDA99DRAFT_560413 [Phascolomyces articulosus]